MCGAKDLRSGELRASGLVRGMMLFIGLKGVSVYSRSPPDPPSRVSLRYSGLGVGVSCLEVLVPRNFRNC